MNRSVVNGSFWSFDTEAPGWSVVALRRFGLVAVITCFWADTAGAYYDPGVQKWVNRDPIAEHGGVNLYSFANNNPTFWVDGFGQDAVTVGPVTIFYNQKDLTPAEKCREKAHEKQHRDDFGSGLPGWKKEQRGFAAEEKALDAAIKKLESKTALTPAEQADLAAARSAQSTAATIANDPNAAIDYWNDTARRWYQSEVPHVPPTNPRPPKPSPTKPAPPSPGTNPPPKKIN
jgi:hypothetical protein